MDQTTHKRRFADWQAIITNCLSRPIGQSKKEWLAEHDVPEKPYYYWQRKLRRAECSEQQPESVAVVHSAYEFAEIPIPAVQAVPETSAPAAVIRSGNIVVELNNSISDQLLGRILEVVTHA